MRNDSLGLSTTSIHAGEASDKATGASAPPPHMSSTFVTDVLTGFSAHDIEEGAGFIYGRWGNPTVAMLERKISMATADALALTYGRVQTLRKSVI